MAKMVYHNRDYYFESEDDRTHLQMGEYFSFVEDCRKFIQEDMDKNAAKRRELVGSK